MRKLIYCVILLMLNALPELAQNSTSLHRLCFESDYSNSNPYFLFDGAGLDSYIQANLEYPKSAREYGIEGEVEVILQILANGQVGSVKILKGLGFGCDAEIIRLFSSMPAWVAATKNGKPMCSNIRIKLKFVLQ